MTPRLYPIPTRHVKLVWCVSRAEAVGVGDRDPIPLYKRDTLTVYDKKLLRWIHRWLHKQSWRSCHKSIHEFPLQNLIFPITTPYRYQSYDPHTSYPGTSYEQL